MANFTGCGLTLGIIYSVTVIADYLFSGLSYIHLIKAFGNMNVISPALNVPCLIEAASQLTRSSLIDVFRLLHINILFKIMTE